MEPDLVITFSRKAGQTMETTSHLWSPIHDKVTEAFRESPLIGALITLVFIDVITGLLCAFIKKEVSSVASLKGMLKKVLVISLVFCGMVMELVYSDIPWGRVIAMFFCLTEIISITENCARVGVPLPRQLTDTLKRLKEASDKPSDKPEDKKE